MTEQEVIALSELQTQIAEEKQKIATIEEQIALKRALWFNNPISGMALKESDNPNLYTQITGLILSYHQDKLAELEFQLENFDIEPSPVSHLVQFQVIGGNGTLICEDENQNTINSEDVVTEDKILSFIATPASGYEVWRWYQDGLIITGETGFIINPTFDKDLDISVEFKLTV